MALRYGQHVGIARGADGAPVEPLRRLERVATTVWQAEAFSADVKELRAKMGYAEAVKSAKAGLARLRVASAGLNANTESLHAAIDQVEKVSADVRAADVEIRSELAELTNGGPSGPLPGSETSVGPTAPLSGSGG